MDKFLTATAQAFGSAGRQLVVANCTKAAELASAEADLRAAISDWKHVDPSAGGSQQSRVRG